MFYAIKSDAIHSIYDICLIYVYDTEKPNGLQKKIYSCVASSKSAFITSSHCFDEV
jgi:hypothetical protein